MSLARSAVRGGATVLASELVCRASGVVGFIVIAGLLGPKDFGRAAVALLAVTAIESLAGLSLGLAVQTSRDRERATRAALAMAIGVGSAGTLGLLAAAGPIASALGAPEAAPLLRAAAPLVLLTRWNEVRRATLEAELRFRLTSASTALAAVIATAVGTGAAVWGAGAWSLVILPLTRETLRCTSMFFGSGPLRPSLDRAAIRDVWQISKHLLGNTIVIFLYTNLDDAATSRFLGTTALGLYVFAYQVSNLPVYFFTRTLDRVLLPTWTRLRDDPIRWGAAYVRSLRVIAWVTGTVQVGLALLGPYALQVLFEDAWDDAAAVLQVLAVYGLFRAVGATCGSVFVAAGDPSLVRRISQLQLAGMLMLLIPALAAESLVGVAAAVTAPLGFATVVALILAADKVQVSRRHLLRSVGEAWLAASVSGFVGLVVAEAVGIHLPSLLAAGLVTVVLSGTYGLLRFRSDIDQVRQTLRPTRRAPAGSI